MTITRLHFSATLLIALALHGGLAAWLSLPSREPFPDPPPLRLSLLAPVTEATADTVPVSEAPILKPPPAPPPKPKPIPKSQSVTRKSPPEPQHDVEPTPADTLPVKNVPEPVREPESLPETATPETPPAPMAASTAPLNAAAAVQYEQLLHAWLERHKRYPRQAKRLRIEGQGLLRIRIDRAGRTQFVSLERRTGNRLLDQAAIEMVRRADPFPPMPEGDSRRELEFIVPVAFMLH